MKEEMRINKDAFTPVTQEDYLRVDNLCRELLLRFYEQLQAGGISPEEATALASGADYFILNFLVDFKGYNLFDERPGIVRQFAGNWYIVNTLEPDIPHLDLHLRGIAAFYRFLRDRQLISAGYLQEIEKECGNLDYYESRIESFWAIEGDGFLFWERECTLKEGWSGTGRA
ncbi:MAG TPA: hypothetical protein VHN12_05220 [Geobacteraceae bacterium]|nr:hypothetical protein [Geobacteraceae bacterium]